MKNSFIRGILFTIFAIVLALPIQSASASIDGAVVIPVNTTQKGTLTDSDDENYYKFTIPAAGNVKLSINNKSGEEFRGEITNSAKELYEDVYTDDSELVSGNTMTEVGLPQGTYYIKIDNQNYHTKPVSYEFKLEFIQSTIYEKEFNNTITNANAINLDTTYKATLSDSDDKDFYKITLPSDGNIMLTMKQKAGAEWYTHIQNSSGKVFESFYTDYSEMVEGYEKTQVGLPKGTYYIQVKNSYQAYDKPYELKVGFTSSEFFEKETNDTISVANDVKLNKDYAGSLRDSNDKDFFKIVVPSDGNITLSIKQKAGTQWYSHIQNSKGEIYETLYTDDSELVEGTASVDVGLPKGTYYIQISNYYQAYEPYSFKVSFKSSSYFEKELNDSLTNANLITMNHTYYGRLSDYDDKDIFKFTVPSDGNVTLGIKQTAGASWYGHIQNSAGTVIKSLYTDDSELVTGNATVQTSLKKGTYYFVLSNYYNAYDKPYQFSITKKSSKLNASQVKITNNKGNNDTIAVSGLVKGDIVKVYNASSKGTLLASKTSTGSSVTLSVKQLSLKSGKVYATITKANHAESDRVAVSYIGEKTDTPKASQVKIINNTGKNDTLAVSSLVKGDIVKVYNASSKGKLLTSATSKGTSTTLSIKQIGTKAGKVYITVTKASQLESSRVAVSYSGEKTMALKASQVKITNNTGKNDTLAVSSLVKGDVVKVYNASSKGKLLTSATSKGTSTTLSIKQIGTKAGKVYITVTKASQLESSRVAVSYNGEKTNAPKASSIKIVNNKKKNDTVTISSLKKGDVVKIYNASTKGKVIATSKASEGSSITVSIKQLGTKAGKIYVTVKSSGMLESSRTAVSFKAE